MSLYTCITLVRQPNTLLDFFSEMKKCQYYVGRLDPGWQIVAVERDQEQKVFTQQVSEKLSTEALYLSSYDTFWEAMFYRNGELITHISLNYEDQAESTFIHSNKLAVIAVDQMKAKELSEKINLMEKTGNIFSLQREIEDAFHLPPLEGIHFDSIQNSEEANIDGIQFELIGEKRKATKKSDTINNTLGSMFTQKGYQFEAAFRGDKHKCVYRKFKEGHEYRVAFDTSSKGILLIEYLLPFSSGLLCRFVYKDVAALKNNLLKVWNEFLDGELLNWDRTEITPFHVEEVYEGIVDPFMGEYHYERAHIDPDLLNNPGSVIYENGNGDVIKFNHVLWRVDIEYMRNGIQLTGGYLVGFNQNLFEFKIDGMLGFQNEQEFQKQLQKLLSILKADFEARLNYQ